MYDIAVGLCCGFVVTLRRASILAEQ